jgi:hypothetical protein
VFVAVSQFAECIGVSLQSYSVSVQCQSFGSLDCSVES